MARIPNGITESDVRDALAALDAHEPHEFGESIGYDLVENDKRYPPKAVLGLAARRILGRPLGPYDFKGGEKSQCFRILRGLGFTIVPKRGAPQPGDDWNEDECRELVEDYFAMLAKEVARVPYSKADHNRLLRARLPGRSKGSIEYKHQNVSGVLFDLGFPFIEGYKPAKNYQRNLLPDIVLEHLGSQEDEIAQIEAAVEVVPAQRTVTVFAKCEVPAPEREEGVTEPPPRGVRSARKYDFAERDAENRKLGRAGEAFIVERERWYLASVGRSDLAAKIEWVSDTQGDGLGYDIVSFDPVSAEPVHIEVKTTNSGREFPFCLSANEVIVSAALGSRFKLYRVFNFSSAPQFYQVTGSLSESFKLMPRLYEARR